MATISRPDLIEDIIFWIPDSNTLTKEDILKVIELIIVKVGDDNIYYSEVLCKSLEAVGLKNLVDSTTSSGGLKKEVLGEHEKEFFKGAEEDSWKSFLSSLTDICPLFGYSPPSILGIKIAPGSPITSCDYEDTEGYL